MKRILFYNFFLLISLNICAQQSMNMNLLSSHSYSSNLSDIWGYATDNGEYALVGLYNGISVVNVSNPSSPIELGFFSGPSSMWRDIKTYGNYLYCINETGGGLQILNLAEVISGNSSPTYIENMSLDFTTAHNLYIDENGILYVFGSSYSNGGAMIFDLVPDPENPVFLGNYSGSYFHDGMVRGDTLWGGAIYNGQLSVVDVSDKANPVLMATQSTPNSFTHNCWISDDGNTVFTTDEVSGAYVTAYDVSDLNDIEELDRIQAWSDDTDVIPHNTHVAGDFLVTSYYRDGVSVVDASNPSNLVEVGYYDTSTDYSGSGFNGAWGTYPFLPSGNILVSDIENGLYVIEPKYGNASFIEGYVTNSVTGAPLSNVTVQILGSNNPSLTALNGFYETGMANQGTYEVFVSVDGYSSQTLTVNLSPESIIQMDVELIPMGCMDSAACNYNPFALIDDGSCAEFDECGECGGDGPSPGQDCDGNCLFGEQLYIEMTDSYGDGWNGNYLVINGDSITLDSGSNGYEILCYDPAAGCLNVSCGGGDWQNEVSWTMYSIPPSFAVIGGAPWSGEVGGDNCIPTVPGCTDTLAINYNSAANEDDDSCEYPIDCEGLTTLMISVGGGSYQSEVSWSIGGFSEGVGDVEVCLEDGCMTFYMYDSYGDGWNQNTVTITSESEVLLTGTLFEGSEGTLSFGLNYDGDSICGPPVPGCTDTLAINYNSAANEDDGSCEYLIDCEGLTTITVAMMDSYGDGWSGNVLTINNETFTLDSGSDGLGSICVDLSSGCIAVTCDGGTWQEEISWTISDENGNQLLNGGAPYAGEYCDSEQSCQTLDFPAGWSIFSTYIMTDDMGIVDVLLPLTTTDNLVIVKDVVGTAYIPDWDFDGIGVMDFKQGYLMKTNFSQSIELCGVNMLPEQHPIELQLGWSMFAYLRIEPADIEAVLEGIVNHIVIVKDAAGNAYLPDWEFNGIGDLESGKGYLIKMSSDQTLNYLSNDQEY